MTQDPLAIILTTAGVILAAVLGWLGTRFKTKADKDTTSTKTLLDGLAARVGSLEAKVRELEADRDQARQERDMAVRQAREAEDTLRDRQELIDDLVQHSEDLMTWGSPTSPPPPPVPSWRIRQHLADLAANAATLRQQERGAS